MQREAAREEGVRALRKMRVPQCSVCRNERCRAVEEAERAARGQAAACAPWQAGALRAVNGVA